MRPTPTRRDPGGQRVVIAPDKFKGTLSAGAVATHLSHGVHEALPGAHVSCVPIAHGGDGTVQSALAAGFEPISVTVTGPLGHPVDATLALGDGRPDWRNGRSWSPRSGPAPLPWSTVLERVPPVGWVSQHSASSKPSRCRESTS